MPARWIQGALVVLVATTSRADDLDPDAAAYARRSTTVFLSTELVPLPTVSAHGATDVTLRFHRFGGLAFATRLGAAYAYSPLGGGDLLGVHTGLAVGYSFPLGRRLALTPMAAGDMFGYWESGGVVGLMALRATVEVPLSILVFPHVVLEPFIQIGIAAIRGTPDFAFVFGPRIGIVL